MRSAPTATASTAHSMRRGRTAGAPGATAAPPPSASEYAEIASKTYFSDREVQGLYARFAELDADGDGLVSADELCSMPELAMYPMLRRMMARYNESRSGALSFGEYARALSTLSGKATLAEKLQFAFSLYDLRGDGTAKAPEVFNLFKLFTGMQHSDEKLQQIVANVMQRYPKGITFADFEQLFCVADVAKMTLNL